MENYTSLEDRMIYEALEKYQRRKMMIDDEKKRLEIKELSNFREFQDRCEKIRRELQVKKASEIFREVDDTEEKD